METYLNGIHLHYVHVGHGPVTVLFVHGYPLDHALWRPQIDGLSDIVHVVAPDLRGFGRTDAPAGVYTMEVQADDLAALLDALRIERAVVCGLSMGGYIALAFWKKYAARVRGLILADTRAGGDSPAARQARLDIIEQVKQRGSEPAAEAMLPRLFTPATYQSWVQGAETSEALWSGKGVQVLPPPRWAGGTIDTRLVGFVHHGMMMRQSPTGIIGAQLGMAERPDSTPTLVTINVPTLCIFGAQDIITPVEPEGKGMAAAIPDAKLVVIPNAGHLSNLEQPEAFNVAVKEFLATNFH